MCLKKFEQHHYLLLRIPALYKLQDIIVRARRSWALCYFDPLVYDWKKKMQLSSSTNSDKQKRKNSHLKFSPTFQTCQLLFRIMSNHIWLFWIFQWSVWKKLSRWDTSWVASFWWSPFWTESSFQMQCNLSHDKFFFYLFDAVSPSFWTFFLILEWVDI